jgi:DNA-directed RNA polymerase subunit M/transcription elongation factor TFIIS
MRFCVNCNNKLYTSLHSEHSDKLVYYCRNCQYTDEEIGEEVVIVLNTQLKKGEQKFYHIINQYTKMDPTLPRINNIKCPNESCITNSNDSEKKEKPEIIYMRYDDNNLKYVYICADCDTIWKTDDRK